MRLLGIAAAVLIGLSGCLAYLVLAPVPGDRWFALPWVVWTLVGAFILWKRPGNGVARAQLWVGVTWGVGFWTTIFSLTDAPLQLRVWSDLLGMLLGILPWFGIVWLMLVFPTGRLEGRLERVTAALLATVAATAVLSFAVTTAPMDGPTGRPSPLASPTLERAVSWIVAESGFWIVVVLVSLAVISLSRRWVRSRGLARHQYRWLLLGAVVFAAVLAIGQMISEGETMLFLWILGITAIPVVTGVAVSRYHLYDIDRILSRTVSYTLVVGLLASLYAVAVFLLRGLLPFEGAMPVAASTLAVAALFNPLRWRVQGWVDRRFNRAQYDARRVAEEFTGSLRDAVDREEIIEGWLEIVSQTMHPAAVGIWVRED